ncbi:MAG: translation elongation factor Ts [Proteobacteria bacterium]|nr:translation elongation factor Ts [Pseudomonadota bacterium]
MAVTISASMVKDLREKTGVGMMECKKALEENSGDMDKAIVWLRERGMSRAAKKADRVAAEGIVHFVIGDKGDSAVLLEVNCETDFVSKNDDFKNFVTETAKVALTQSINDVEKLSAMKLSSGTSIDETIKGLIQKIGENMRLRRVQVLKYPGAIISGYSHMGGKIGTLCVLEGASGANVQEVGKDIAMHIAAAFPKYLNRTEVDQSELAQERDIARKKLVEEKKPEAMIDKILEGQMNKFYKEVCLVEQAFVKDPDTSITKLLEKTDKNLKLSKFLRFQLGEGIEKKQENFAAEVAAQLGR